MPVAPSAKVALEGLIWGPGPGCNLRWWQFFTWQETNVLYLLALMALGLGSSFFKAPQLTANFSPGVALELLDTPDKDLEANARKIKHICREDLEYIVQEGKFNLKSTKFGNILWAILNSLADVWAIDTELVESINSMIRLIGTRSPRIELIGMSSRIMIKKSILPLGPVKRAAAKKWSVVRSCAQPVLKELVETGTGFKEILSQTDRFTTVEGVNLHTLHDILKNDDLRASLPEVAEFGVEALQWAHRYAIQWKRQSEREDAGFTVLRFASLVVLQLKVPENRPLCDDDAGHDSHGHEGHDGSSDGNGLDGKMFARLAYVRAASCRTRVLMTMMEAGIVSCLSVRVIGRYCRYGSSCHQDHGCNFACLPVCLSLCLS